MVYVSTRVDGTTVDYLSVAETAKLVRAALRDAFPGFRFSVRSESYAGGASIDVRYVDGPDRGKVEDVVAPFWGGAFDGMIDMKISVYAVVDAAGRIVGHRSPGTVGSRGVLTAIDDPIPPGGRLVSFGADYIFVERDWSPATRETIEAKVRSWYGVSDVYAAPLGAVREAERTLGDLPPG